MVTACIHSSVSCSGLWKVWKTLPGSVLFWNRRRVQRGMCCVENRATQLHNSGRSCTRSQLSPFHGSWPMILATAGRTYPADDLKAPNQQHTDCHASTTWDQAHRSRQASESHRHSLVHDVCGGRQDRNTLYGNSCRNHHITWSATQLCVGRRWSVLNSYGRML